MGYGIQDPSTEQIPLDVINERVSALGLAFARAEQPLASLGPSSGRHASKIQYFHIASGYRGYQCPIEVGEVLPVLYLVLGIAR